MKTKDFLYITVICVIILTVLFCSNKCNRDGNYNGQSDTSITVITEYVTVHDTIIKYTPKPYKVVDTDTIYQLDSAECRELAKKYYAELIYNDTLINDSTLFFSISETVSRNMIVYRSVNYIQSKQVETITKTINVYDKNIFIGDISIISDFKSLQFAVKLGGSFVYKNNGVRLGVQSNGLIEVGYVRKFNFMRPL